MANTESLTMDDSGREDMKCVSSFLIEENGDPGHDRSDHVNHVLSKEPFHLRDSAIADVMSPLHLSMSCFGLNVTGKHSLIKGIKCNCYLIHCCITLSLAWSMALGFFASYEKTESFEQGLFQKLFLHIFVLQMALCISIHVYDKHKHMAVFLKLWDNYKIKHGGTRLNLMKAYIKKWVILVNSAYILFFFIFLIWSAFNMEMFVDFIQPVFWFKKYLPIENKLLLIYPMYLIAQYLIMATAQPVILAFCTNHLLKEEFSHITKEFSEAINYKLENGYASHPDGNSDSQLLSNETEKYRLRHLEVCTLIRLMDDVSSSFHAIFYTSSIPIIILLILSLSGIGDGSYHREKGIYCVTVVIFIVVLLVLTISAANLATTVSKYF